VWPGVHQSSLFFVLTLTSQWQHGLSTPFTKVIDQAAIAFVVFFGGIKFFKSYEKYYILKKLVIFICFFSCIFLYNYGKASNQFCFDPDMNRANKWHAAMHLCSSLGHHLIASV
jgi:hypothetical protein